MMADRPEARLYRVTTLRDLWDHLGDAAGQFEDWLVFEGDTLVELQPESDPDHRQVSSTHVRVGVMLTGECMRFFGWFVVEEAWLHSLFPLNDLNGSPNDLRFLESPESSRYREAWTYSAWWEKCVNRNDYSSYVERAERFARMWKGGGGSVRATRRFLLELVPIAPIHLSWKIVMGLKALIGIEGEDADVLMPDMGVTDDGCETDEEWYAYTIASVCQEIAIALARPQW